MEHASEECTCEGKFCKDCAETKCLGYMQFTKRGDKTYYIARCISCKNAKQRAWAKSNTDKTREIQRKYTKKRQESDKARPISESLVQRKRENARAWNKAHPEELKAHKKTWELSHLEHKRAYAKVYAKAYYSRPGTKDRIRSYYHKRRARKKAVPGTHTSQQIHDQLKRQRHKCYYCQKRLQKQKDKYIYHIEHTFPLSRVAGTDIPANSIDYLVLACPICNFRKGNKFPWEWPEGGRLL